MTPAEERKARLAACGPGDQVTGSSLIGVSETLNALAPGAPGVAALLSQEAGRRRANDLRYPLTEFLELAFQAADLLAPRLPPGQDPLEAIGLGIARFWINMPAAQVAMKLIEGKNPVELMATVPSVMRSRYSFGERSYERSGPLACTIHIQKDPVPVGLYVGLLGNTARLNRHLVQVRGEAVDLLRSRIRVDWDGRPPPA